MWAYDVTGLRQVEGQGTVTVVPLAEVCTITMGQAPVGASYNDVGEGLPLVAGAGDFGDGVPRAKKFTTAPAKVSQPGDVILGIRASIGERVWSDAEYCLGRGVAGLRPSARLDGRYLWHWLGRAAPALAAKGRGATFLQVSRADIGELELPLPPLDEQRRLAAILDHADALAVRCERSQAAMSGLSRALFASIADGSRSSLGDLGVTFVAGRNVVGEGADVHPVNRVIKVSAISSGEFIPSESKPLPSAYAPPSEHRIRHGDILFGRASGSLHLLGATAVVGAAPDDLYLPDKVWRLVVPPDAPTNAEYVLGVLRSQEFLAFVRHHASGAAGVRNIGKSAVLGFEAPVPTLARQQEYALLAQRARELSAVAKAASGRAAQLCAALRASAFSGAL